MEGTTATNWKQRSSFETWKERSSGETKSSEPEQEERAQHGQSGESRKGRLKEQKEKQNVRSSQIEGNHQCVTRKRVSRGGCIGRSIERSVQGEDSERSTQREMRRESRRTYLELYRERGKAKALHPRRIVTMIQRGSTTSQTSRQNDTAVLQRKSL